MNQHSSSKQKYYRPLIGAALVAASLFQFSFPVFAAGTAAGEVLRNTATGSYEDDAGNPYTIESNTVDVTVAKIAGITNQPAGITDETVSATNTSVLTGDRVSFEFEITNVGNDVSNIFIPSLGNITTRGLNRNTAVSANANENFVIQVSPALDADGNVAGGGAFAFTDIPATGAASEPRPGNGIVADVPINGKVLVKVTGTVTATAAGAPIEVLLGNTGPNTDPNAPVAATQNQPDLVAGGDTGGEGNDVRTETSTAATVTGDPVGDGQKEASALQQVFLGSNPLAMTRVEKVRGDVRDGADPNALNDNIIPYSLELEVLNTTANSLYTPGDLEGRDFDGRITGIAAADDGNLILISDAIPANTTLNAAITPVGDWTPIYTTETDNTIRPDAVQWTTTAPPLANVTRVGWVYDARTAAPGDGPIPAGTTVLTADGGFTFEVITSGLNATTGGTVANIAQVFGTTDDGDPATLIGVEVFDESGDQNPSNFNANGSLGPNEDAPQSTGIANPANHGVDSENNNNANGVDPASPGGEDNVITIGAPGQLINGPGGQPTATGDVFGVGPDNDHDFQNKGVDNFPANAKHNNTPNPTQFDPNLVSFTNTLSNPGTTDLSNVLLQPINPEFEAGFSGADVTDEDLPIGTTVKLTLGGQEATYTYQDNAATPGDTTDRLFVLTTGTPIIIPTLAAGVPLDYTVEVDLPPNTGLSTDDAINGGFPVPIIAFQDNITTDGTPNAGENRNLTVNQVYTGHIKVSKQAAVIDTTGTAATNPNFGTVRPNMGFDDSNANKEPLPGDTLEYRVIYRNISEPQVGTGNNLVLNGVDVMIDEDGTLDAIDNGTLDASGNNWGLDSNTDGDIDTINVQGSASDTNSGTINFFTGEVTVNTPLGTGMVPAGTTDPGDTVTGYRVTVPLLAPVGTEAPAQLDIYNPGNGDSAFTFRRKVDQFDGLAQEGLD